MDVIFLIGRVLLALIFLGSAFGHLADSSSVEYAESKGLPNAKTLVQVSGLTMLAGAIGIIFGIWIDLALLGMTVQVLIHAFVMHRFWSEAPETQQLEMSMFMKNLSMAGGSLALFGLLHVHGEAPVSLTDLLF